MKVIKNVRNEAEIPKEFTGIIEWYNGTIYYYKNGKYHREDGPAIITAFEKGAFRLYKGWYFNGQIYREDGPALIWCNGVANWVINGINVPRDVWFEKLTLEQKMKALYNPENW